MRIYNLTRGIDARGKIMCGDHGNAKLNWNRTFLYLISIFYTILYPIKTALWYV